MAIKTRHEQSEDTWFITFTCHDWIPLFEITQSYDMVYDWLKFITHKYRIKTLAFVIMPNHVHALLWFNDLDIQLNKVISNGKRFMAYEIIKRLEKTSQFDLLNSLATACTEKEQIKGQKHKVFEPSFDAKAVFTLNFLHQKLDYIHANPVSGKWNLAEDFSKYPHSSAAFYHDGVVHDFVDICNYSDIWGG